MIEMGKEYRLANGDKYRLLATDGGGNYPVVGLIEGRGEHGIIRHTADGRLYAGSSPSFSEYDLVEVKPKFRLERWVNVYVDSRGVLSAGGNYRSADAAAGAVAAPVARIKVVIEGELGQFDQ